MTEYNHLIARAAQGEHITPQQLAQARYLDDQRADRDAKEQQIADDLAAAAAAFDAHRVAHDAEHLPILEGMIEELQAAHQDVVDAYPAYQAALKAYNQIKAARHAKHTAIRDYVKEHYGHKDRMIDLTTGRPHYDTHIGGMEAVIVEGQIIHPDGTSRPDGVTGVE